MGVLMFNGVSSKDIGLEVETFPTYDIPRREYNVYHVPGRNGDIIIDTGTFENVYRTYKVSIATWDKVPYSVKMNRVAEWLHSTSGYARLEDSYDKDYYRMAYYTDPLSFENLFDEAGRGELKFVCKPQRYLKSGEVPLTLNMPTGGAQATMTINNKTGFNALPLFQVTHDGTNESAFDVINNSGMYTIGVYHTSLSPVYVDSELQDAWAIDNSGTTPVIVNENSLIAVNNGEFPRLTPGLNTINIYGGVSSMSILPRWWTI